MPRIIVTPQSTNTKTGNIPQVWIGGSYEEGKRTCDKVECKLRPWIHPKGFKGMACYAWGGSSMLGFGSAIKADIKAGGVALEVALERRSPQAKAIRLGAIGDPGVMPWGWWFKLERLAKRLDLTILSYTHGWRQRPDLAGRTMASCDSIAEAVEARKLGFQPAIATREVSVLDKNIRLPDGSKAVVCPAMSAKAKRNAEITCNQCRKCDGRSDVAIIFPDHGRTAPRS